VWALAAWPPTTIIDQLPADTIKEEVISCNPRAKINDNNKVVLFLYEQLHYHQLLRVRDMGFMNDPLAFIYILSLEAFFGRQLWLYFVVLFLLHIQHKKMTEFK
jgi:hypothetical protein